jgi:DGQHR domain-containing protein
MSDMHTRSKEEYIELVKAARKENGDDLHLPIFRLRQGERFEIFSFPLRQDFCQLLFQRLPRTFNNLRGIQRAFKSQKIADIREQAANDPLYSAPGSIVVTIHGKSRSWVTVRWNGDGRIGELVVDLKQIANTLTKLKPGEDGSLDEEQFKIGYMIDAHHRNEGHYQAERMDLEMAAVAYVDLNPKYMARVFSQVNDKQEKPSPTHTLAMRQMAGMLQSDEKTAVEISQAMNDDSASVLYQRVKIVDGKLPKGHPRSYLNLKTLSDLVRRHMLNEIPGSELATKQEVIEQYFRGWRASFSDAWEDESTHVLVKAMGFSIMAQVFGKVFEIAQSKFHTEAPTESQIQKVLGLLHSMKLETKLEDGSSVTTPMDWSSERFGGLSSGKGINFVSSEIRRYLTNQKMKLLKSS